MRIKTKLIVAAAACCFSMALAAQNITLSIRNLTLRDAIHKVEKKSGYSFMFSSQDLDLNRRVSLEAKNSTIRPIVERLLKEQDGLTFDINGKTVVIRRVFKPQEQNGTSPLQPVSKKSLRGHICDSKGEPIIGATVKVHGASFGTITDAKGNFQLEAPLNAMLDISYIGYQDRTLRAADGMTVTLTESSRQLSEVVVTALGIRREEKALGYSTQKLEGDALSKVKSTNVAASMTGKIAGMNVQNSTEFNEAPVIKLRGETPLLVVDGVPYHNLTLRDIAADDIESVSVLKGATASALYGDRGGSGAIMITTKHGQKEGFSVTFNSSTMFNAGFLRLPKVQTSYSSGSGGKYKTGDYVWGDRLDIGREASQYNPQTHEWEVMPLVSKGKDNLKNFSQFSFVTNNNLSIEQNGKYGGVRSSLTYVYNKGQWPNERLNKLTYAVSGHFKYKKFSGEAGVTYNRRFFPNDEGTGYGGNGYLYNLLIWSGTEFDIRDYRNYWVKKDEQSNWMDRSWYDNPYYMAYEVTHKQRYDVTNAFFSGNYELLPWLKLTLRSGIDTYTEKDEYQTPVGSVSGWGNKKGYYHYARYTGLSSNTDAMLLGNYKYKDFQFDGFFGGTIYYFEDDGIYSETSGGLLVPGYYSLNASVDPPTTGKSESHKQVNSLYGKIAASWKSTVFIEFTGRNDWSSTLPPATRSYFYPSVAGSVVLSQFVPLPKEVSFWKIRGAWTQTKHDMGIYSINNAYSLATNVWDNMTAVYSPSTIHNAVLSPSASRTYELGTAAQFLDGRLRFDLTYYHKLNYNNTRSAGLTPTSGYTNTLINMEEEQVRKGWEVVLSGDIVKNQDLVWSATFNWSRDRFYYGKVDPVYSTQHPWVKKGKRWDWVSAYDYQRDPDGNIVHGSDGMPLYNPYATVQGYSEPDWIWGLNTTVSWKNFTLSLSIDGRVGGIAHSVIDQAMWNSGVHPDSDNQYRYEEVVNGNKTFVGKGVKVVSGSADWDSDGNIVRDNRVFAPNDKVVSYESYMLKMNPYIGSVRTQNLLDQTFFKLRELAISYDVPQSFCRKFRAERASISFIGQNLLIWTKEFRFSDPDKASENLNSPSIRYLGFNLKLTF